MMNTHSNPHKDLIQLFITLCIVFIATLIGGALIEYGFIRVAYLMPVAGGIVGLLYLRSGMFLPRVLQQSPGRNGYRQRGLDPNRSDGDRPYKHLDDATLKTEYVEATRTVREADEGGFHLSPQIDRATLLREEWGERGNDKAELDQALRDVEIEGSADE